MDNDFAYIEEVKFICKNLNLPIESVQLDEKVSPIKDGFYHLSSRENEFYTFNLLIEEDSNQTKADLWIYCKDTPKENFYHLGKNEQFNVRWLDKVISDLINKKGKVDYYIEDYRFTIASEMGSMGENHFLRDLNGLLNFEPEKLHFMQIKHIRKGDNYRAFSYGLFDFLNNEWRIYPWCGSLDSGGGGFAHRKIFNAINEAGQNLEINRINLTVDFDEFKKRFDVEKNPFIIDFSYLDYMENFSHKSKEISSLIESNNVLDAIKEMRILIDSLCDKMLSKNELKFDGDKLIGKFSFLIGKNKIPEYLRKHIETFLICGNPASHKVKEEFWKSFRKIKDQDEFLNASLYCGLIIIKYLDRSLPKKKRKFTPF